MLHSPDPSCAVLGAGSFDLGVKLDVLVGAGVQVVRLREWKCALLLSNTAAGFIQSKHRHTHKGTWVYVYKYAHKYMYAYIPANTAVLKTLNDTHGHGFRVWSIHYKYSCANSLTWGNCVMTRSLGTAESIVLADDIFCLGIKLIHFTPCPQPATNRKSRSVGGQRLYNKSGRINHLQGTDCITNRMTRSAWRQRLHNKHEE